MALHPTRAACRSSEPGCGRGGVSSRCGTDAGVNRIRLRPGVAPECRHLALPQVCGAGQSRLPGPRYIALRAGAGDPSPPSPTSAAHRLLSAAQQPSVLYAAISKISAFQHNSAYTSSRRNLTYHLVGTAGLLPPLGDFAVGMPPLPGNTGFGGVSASITDGHSSSACASRRRKDDKGKPVVRRGRKATGPDAAG